MESNPEMESHKYLDQFTNEEYKENDLLSIAELDVTGIGHIQDRYTKRLQELEALVKQSQIALKLYSFEKEHSYLTRISQIINCLHQVREELDQISKASSSQLQSLSTRLDHLKRLTTEILEKHCEVSISVYEQKIQALQSFGQEWVKDCLYDKKIQEESTQVNIMCCFNHYTNSSLCKTTIFEKLKSFDLIIYFPCVRFIQRMNVLSMLRFKTIRILSFPRNLEIIKSTLDKLPLDGCEKIVLCSSSRYNSHISISRYMTCITRNRHKILNQIDLQMFRINESQLARLFITFKHIKSIGLEYCNLSLSGIPDFTRFLKATSLQYLGLSGSESAFCSNWENNPSAFEDFIKSLSDSDLKKSLKRIHIGPSCALTRGLVTGVLNKSGLPNVVILGQFSEENLSFNLFGDDY
ncbi:unnamed protein product [Moneuplotes crassus]|uniref:Uncharacterized protein n=1 Tax=Euplotes crassus TaxID=5936 RepID=A0AAD1XFT2_EUPCR|nr:unnamed protein product [Moneuplotes crassus]